MSAGPGASFAGGGGAGPYDSTHHSTQPPLQPSRHPHDTTNTVYRELKDPHRVFDKQVARSDAYQTDGINGTHAWVKRTRNHLIGTVSDLEHLLEWAERQGTRPITLDMVKDVARQYNVVYDPLEISAHLS